ncbi:hypothetical protein HDU98_008782 [Podochytrium sp. JEL0797]|nr:hypothetical protein HDU98_008782 [Podochytrium sp. JEL0797]
MDEYKTIFPTPNDLINRVQIHLLPAATPPFPNLLKKHVQFNSIFLSNTSAHHLSNIPPECLMPHATVHVETARYMLDLKAEQVAAFQEKVLELGKAAGFHTLKGYKENVDAMVLVADGLECDLSSKIAM